MKIVIFGVGVYYDLRKNTMDDKMDIVSFIDNNPELWNQTEMGIPIRSPESVKNLLYDRIVLMSQNTREMEQQLIDLGVEKSKIKNYEQFCAEINNNKLEIYFNNVFTLKKRKNVLITLPLLGYNGASMVSMYTAEVLQKSGYQITLAAISSNQDFVDSLTSRGYIVIIFGGLSESKAEEMFWIESFDFVIANTYYMLKFAIEANKIKPCLLWLHDPHKTYIQRFRKCEKIVQKDMENLEIFAVSTVAKKNFELFYPMFKVNVLEYGIPDKNFDYKFILKRNKIIFAIIGYVSEIKAQDIFVKAISKLSETDKLDAEFWIIGTIGNNKFCQNIKEISINNNIRILGELNRDEIENKYQEIDVIVNCSREDAFPVVVAEGMMYGKVCITSESTGMASYIKNGENGFLCKTENIDDLCNIIQWIILHKEALQNIRRKARQTYVQYFTMKKFAQRLEEIIK